MPQLDLAFVRTQFPAFSEPSLKDWAFFENAGGSYAFADTDSMAIVANESGGLIPCKGGPHRFPDGRPAIRALSWEMVDSIVDQFAALNPYDRGAVSGSILKIEDVNFDPDTGKRRLIHAFAISAKRYALFTIDREGRPEVIEGGYSEHGLGHLLNPIDPDSEDKIGVELKFESFDDFTPELVAEQVDPLKKLMEKRQDLQDLKSKLATNRDLNKAIQAALGDDDSKEQLKSELDSTEGEE